MRSGKLLGREWHDYEHCKLRAQRNVAHLLVCLLRFLVGGKQFLCV
jgi:hypothetical protein